MKQKIDNNHPTIDKLEIMFENSERRKDEKAKRYRDEILNKADEVLGILAQMREDRLYA